MRRFLIAAGLAFAVALPAAAQTVQIEFAPAFQKKLDKDYGVREATELKDELQKRVLRAFEAKSAKPSRLVLTVEDAKPNKPTMQQLIDEPGLDYMRSVSNGGAEVKGVAFDTSGKQIGEASYHWYETDISWSLGKSTWWDARRAFDGFAKRFAEKTA